MSVTLVNNITQELTSVTNTVSTGIQDHNIRAAALRDQATTRMDELAAAGKRLANTNLLYNIGNPMLDHTIRMSDMVNVTAADLKTVDPVDPLLLNPELGFEAFTEYTYGPLEPMTSAVTINDVPKPVLTAPSPFPDKPSVKDLVTPPAPELTIPKLEELEGKMVPFTMPGAITLNMPALSDEPVTKPELNIPQLDVLFPVFAPDIPVFAGVTLPAFTPDVLSFTPNIPVFEGVHMPVFDSPRPEFTGDMAERGFTYAPTALAYASVGTIGEYTTLVRDMFAGNTGIPAEVEAAMWARAAEREDTILSQEISKVTTDYASRGFTMPPGMLVAQVDALTAEASIKKRGLSRDVAIKVADSVLENLRFACTQTLAAGALERELWATSNQVGLEAAKFDIESHLHFVNAQVNLFNAQQQAYSVDATVFRAKIEAEVSKIGIFKSLVDAEISRAGVYKTQAEVESVRASVFKTQVDAELSKVAVFKTEVEAEVARAGAYKIAAEVEGIKADVFKTRLAGEMSKLDVFKALISAEGLKVDVFKGKVEAELSKLTVFKSQLDAENAKMQVNEQLVKIYSSVVQATQAKADVYKSQVNAVQAQADIEATKIKRYAVEVGAYAESFSAAKNEVTVYDSLVRGEASKAQIIQAEASAYAAYVGGKSDEFRGKLASNEFRKLNNEQRLQARMAALETERIRIAAQRVEVEGSIDQLKRSVMERELAHSEHATDVRAQIALNEFEMRREVTNYEIAMKQVQWSREQMLKANEIIVEVAKGIAQSSATLAAGSMAGLSIGASMSMNAGASYSAGVTDSYGRTINNTLTSKGADNTNAAPQWDGGAPF
jgi:hypothetical protein